MAEESNKSAAPALLVCALLAAAVIAMVLPERGAGSEEVDLSSLTASTTNTRLPDAPRDPSPQRATRGVVVHPVGTIAVRETPGGEPFAKIGPRQFGPTWLPVIARSPGWVRVLLPSRPNASSGWVSTDDVRRKQTPYLIRVHLGSRTVDLFEGDSRVGSWSVGVGTDATPTPTGRTFLLGSFTDDQQSFSPVILPLGAHSATLDSYGGGPGTVAFHGWRDSSVFGQAVSHGCIRVPDDALTRLSEVPLGTLVLIDRA